MDRQLLLRQVDWTERHDFWYCCNSMTIVDGQMYVKIDVGQIKNQIVGQKEYISVVLSYFIHRVLVSYISPSLQVTTQECHCETTYLAPFAKIDKLRIVQEVRVALLQEQNICLVLPEERDTRRIYGAQLLQVDFVVVSYQACCLFQHLNKVVYYKLYR